MELPKGKVNANINVTPLVDVMLVLLIIFMVVTPMLGSMVALPVTDDPAKQPEDKDQILVAMRYEEGADTVELVQGSTKEVLALDALSARLAEYREHNRNADVVIQGDARLDYGMVKRAMLRVKDAGFEHVGLITKPKGVSRGAA